MIPPGKEPTKRPGSKGTSSTPKSPSKPVAGEKPASKPIAKTPTPAPAAAGKPSKLSRTGGGAAPLRRMAPAAPGAGKQKNIKVIAIGAAVGIAAIIGVLFVIKSGRVNPEELKAALKAKIEEIEKLGPDQIVEKYKQLQELQKNPDYTLGNCGGERKRLDKAVEDAAPLAKRQLEADDDALPFLQEYEQAKGSLNPAKAQNLLDRGFPLYQDYGTTTHGPKLEEACRTLRTWLEEHATTGEGPEAAWPPVKAAADRAANDGEFKRAFGLLADYVKEYGDRLTSTGKRNVDELTDSLKRKLKKFIEDTTTEANDLNDKGQGDAAKAKLKQAMESTEGLEGYKDLESLYKGLGGQ